MRRVSRWAALASACVLFWASASLVLELARAARIEKLEVGSPLPRFLVNPSIDYERTREDGQRVRVVTWYSLLTGRIQNITLDAQTETVLERYVGPPAFELHDARLLAARFAIVGAIAFLGYSLAKRRKMETPPENSVESARGKE